MATTEAPRRKPRRPTIQPLVGRAEAAEILGVHPNNMHKIAAVPEPIAKVRATPLWTRAEIEWLAEQRKAAA